ncbi:MAG TPA: hypothetical protein VGO22_18110 [Pseudorhizobium sp.]|nr:hypothetical protein [Pseudorhizobium sp.]
MTRIEFIGHSKHLGRIRDSAEGTVLLVPLKLHQIISQLLKREGWHTLVASAVGRRDVVDLRPLVERNLLRRRIRLGWFYGRPFVAALYRTFTLARARIAARLVQSYLDEHPGARVMAFNGFLIPDALALAVGEALGRERMVLELGFFPATNQYDTRGINYDSSLPRDPAFYRMVANRVPAGIPAGLVKRVSKQKPTKSATMPGRYVFVPFQVPSDMQVLAHSPWIRDMVHFYEVIARLADKRPDLNFVVKEHPSFPLSIQDRVRKHHRISFANHNETRSLIEGAQALIVINSTVGLEGLFLQKKVVTLGNAPYNVEGLVLHAEDEEALLAAVDVLDTWTPDPDLRAAYIRYVYNVFLLKGDHKAPDDQFLSALRRRAARKDEHSLLLEGFAAVSGRDSTMSATKDM